MPGILPMKVIKVGATAQTRIAQACDRCRSKKIRCDGVRPCCSQCAAVSFECKTSDKLSRRAFPRGYTESLEERVRGLETEVRELKELLDEKDEKIDMLSKMRSQSSVSVQLPSVRRSSVMSATSSGPRDCNESFPEKVEVFRVQQPPCVLNDDDDDDSNHFFAGASSSCTFIEAFRLKAQETGRMNSNSFDTAKLIASSVRRPVDSSMAAVASPTLVPPPRVVSDRLVNIFFQEWAPLFPILHRPTFLGLYERYVNDVASVTNPSELAQLNLVFGIACCSDCDRSSDELDGFETQAGVALAAIISENSMPALQAFLLAQLLFVQQGDMSRLLTYKGLSTSLSARLGLHQSQKQFSLGTLSCETRKKVFWTLYTVDCFTAVTLGLPRHLKDEDIQCEYPVDADDEYVTQRGFQPSLPGESTKLSSALALFRASRILAQVLEYVYPAKASYELSLKRLSDLQDELDLWKSSLAPHLRLQFAQDKPSTGTVSSRSPLLSLTYHYTRSLISRPMACGAPGGDTCPAMLAHASACKHMLQIVQLLEERGLSFSFCLSKDELLVVAGFGLLFQTLKLESGSKLLKDNTKTIQAVVTALNQNGATSAAEFTHVASSFVPISTSPQVDSSSTDKMSRHDSNSPIPAITVNPLPSLPASTRRHLKAIASRSAAGSQPSSPEVSNEFRQATMSHGANFQLTVPLKAKKSSDRHSVSRSEPARTPEDMHSRPSSTTARLSASPVLKNKARPTLPTKGLNLDYLSFGPESGPKTPRPRASPPPKTEAASSDWAQLLGSLDNGVTNIYDACYGGRPIEALMDDPRRNKIRASLADEPMPIAPDDDWAQLCRTDTGTTTDSGPTRRSRAVGSIVSSLSSDDDDGVAVAALAPPRRDSTHDDLELGDDWMEPVTKDKMGKRLDVAPPTTMDVVDDFVNGIDDLTFSSAWDDGVAMSS